MRNRIHRYQQRSNKHREQQRIPDFFEDEDPYNDDISDDDCWCSMCNHKYYPLRDDIVVSDCESVDSYSNYKRNNSHNRAKKENNNSHAAHAAVQNRYAALDMEERSLSILLGEDTSGDDIDGDGDAHQSKECLIKTVTYDTDTAVKRQKWIDSWSEKSSCEDTLPDEEEIWVVTVDGYFRKRRKAGYGVMIRNRYGVPILASASAYDQGKPVSWLYHALQGIDRCLELAIKYGFRNAFLYYTLPPAIDNLIQNILIYRRSSWFVSSFGGDSALCNCKDGNPDFTSEFNCENCSIIKHNCMGEDEFRQVYRLIHQIAQKCFMFDGSEETWMTGDVLYCVNTKGKYNVPADYLAKLQGNKKEMRPDEFPEELKDILYADAHNKEMMCSNDGRRWSIFPRRI